MPHPSTFQEYSLHNLYNLTGTKALVTGGGTGIGLAIACGLAANGATVYITGRRNNVLQQVANKWNAQGGGPWGVILPLQMDVTRKESIIYVRDFIKRAEGQLHILVNKFYAGQVGPITATSDVQPADAEALGDKLFSESAADWANLYSVNTFPIFFVTTAFLGLLASGSQELAASGRTSCVINITSISGLTKLSQHHFAYNSAKSAASHLTKLLSTEFALKGIPVRVNAIAPGVYESEMTSDEIVGREMVDQAGRGTASVPAGRPGTAQEIAGTVIYLASSAGSYTNGQEIVIDGGYLAVNPGTV